MGTCRPARFVLPALLSLLLTGSLHASTVMQLNLGEMVQRAQLIYRGTVLAVTPGTVAAGGGQLPTTTYRLRVDESFRGDFIEVKGMRIAELRTLGKMAPRYSGNLRLAVTLPRMPDLAVGQSYLVMTTRPSAVGLSTTVGLGQGCFRISQVGKQEQAVNEANNNGLFRDMPGPGPALLGAKSAAAAAARPGGPLPYGELATRIRGLVTK